MRTFLAAISAAVFAIASGTAVKANDHDTLYYTGGFSCDGNQLRTDWSVHKDVSGKISAIVYYRQDSNQAQWLALTESRNASGSVLSDANGNPRLDVAPDGDGLHATWVKGPPGASCTPISVDKSESPKVRFDTLFTLLDRARPTEDDAKKVAEILRSLPIFDGLPELDQRSYLSRYSQSNRDFWKRYRQVLSDEIEQLPVSSPADRQIVATRFHAALNDTLLASWQDGGSDQLSRILDGISDRLADSGATTASFDMSETDSMCARLRLVRKIEASGQGYRLKDLEFVTSVSFDYWTRDIADSFLDGAKACGDQEQFIRNFTSNWDAIQQRQQLIAAMRTERDRLLALPVSIQTLIDTKNLQPDVQALKIGFGQSDLIERFLGKPLDARRDALLNFTIESLHEQSRSYTTEKLDVAKTIDDSCNKLAYLPNLSSAKAGQVRQECDAATASIAMAQANDAVKKVEAAFLSVKPLTPPADAARKLCADLPTSLSSQATLPVLEACQTKIAALDQAERAQTCSNAAEGSGASSSLLESTVAVAGVVTPTKATLKDMVCGASQHGLRVSFHSTGALMWTTQHMDIRTTRGGEEQVLHFLLSASDTGADWAISTDDEGTKQKLEHERMPVELVSACFMGSPACHPE